VSRMGIVHSIMIGGDAVVIEDVRAWAMARLSGRCTVYGLMPRAGPCGSPIRGAGHDYQMVRIAAFTNNAPGSPHTLNVQAYERRLLAWLRTFRGVATRYREHYLFWHRLIDADEDLLWARAAIMRSLALNRTALKGPDAYTERPP
ncbi:MAG: hypothetical protein ACREK1_07635, partial [Longimicrobiales bacterium]